MTKTAKSTPAHDDQGYPSQERAECDPSLLDDLKCKAEGIEAQAAYNEEHMPALITAREEYDKARAAYTAARTAAAPAVDWIRDVLDEKIDQLICNINDDRVVHRVNRAWGRVGRRLDKCGGIVGCCLDGVDCDFSPDCDANDDELYARIADFGRRTAEAEKCFGDLIKEPTELTARVAKLKATVEGIDTKPPEGEGKTKPADEAGRWHWVLLYAKALVAQRDLDDVWHGFDTSNDYVDCLCRALECSLRGRTALAELTGELAVRDCHERTRVERCKHLRANTAEEIIAEYERRRRPPKQEAGDDSEGEPYDQDDEDDEDDEDDDDYEESGGYSGKGRRRPAQGGGRGHGDTPGRNRRTGRTPK